MIHEEKVLVMGKQAAFFFGSGISYASGSPSVDDITIAALKEHWHFCTEGIFLRGVNSNHCIPDQVTPLVQAFLQRLFKIAADCKAEVTRITPALPPHYEELFSLSAQIVNVEQDHIPNLAIVDYLRRVRSDTADLYIGYKGGPSGLSDLGGLAEDTCIFLHWVVDSMLRSIGENRKGLGLISEVANSVDNLDVFTLNHDLLVEKQLESNGIFPQMGFDDYDHGDFRVYQTYWWKNTSKPRSKVRMLKLHGSLNWWFYDFPDWARQYAIPNKDPRRCCDQNQRTVNPVDGRSAFLSGTIVKELHYGLAFWGEQLEAFRDHLSNHHRLICCGYGFGDRGINVRIDQWMHNDLNGRNRLVILTPQSKDIFVRNKPYWLIRHIQNNRVDFVENYLENCTLSDLEPYFDVV
ncbi:MAG: SIR2 family protein [Opitutales bacterium]|nr:SIR2 family protein [Opitutales bacterium]